MSGKGSRNHTHKYFKSDGLWYCGLADCTHYMPKNIPSIKMFGKNSICWECNKEFQLSEKALDKEQPICDSCQEQLDKTKKFLQEKGLI